MIKENMTNYINSFHKLNFLIQCNYTLYSTKFNSKLIGCLVNISKVKVNNLNLLLSLNLNSEINIKSTEIDRISFTYLNE